VRTAFIKALVELAEQDSRINLLVGDLGFSVVEQFAERFPSRYLNVGVAEQNMTGIAAGMALCGKIVFTYSIGNFPILRCLEQIRNDVCYHHADVKIVSIGGGLTYGPLGMTHHTTEDLAIMRALPGMTVVAPGDPVEAAAATAAIASTPGPCYLRLGKAGEPVVHDKVIDFRLGKAITVAEGSDITLIATGGLLYNTVRAGDALRERGVSVRVLSMPTIKPLDEQAILDAAQNTSAIITIEEHSIIGGLGGAVAEVLAGIEGPRPKLTRIGLPSALVTEVGTQDYLRRIHSLSVEGILGRVQPVLKILSAGRV
jgi:transketolase